VNKTTPDPGTPIFGELNEELGELPEIVVHDFDSHGFQFGSEASDDKGDAEPESARAGDRALVNTGGRRRRKED
jgi:hypothetical protein